MKSFTENVQTVAGLAPDADRWNADPSTDWVSLKKYQNVCFIIHEGTGTTGTAVITVNEASANDGTGSAAIAFRYRQKANVATTWGAWQTATSSGFTTDTGGAQMYAIEIHSSELSDGKPYVNVTGTEGVDAATDAEVSIHLFNARHPQETLEVATD